VDKRVIFAVAGAGKTKTIIDKLSLEEKSLIVTYTDNNYSNLKQRVIKKFGYIPENTKIYTYFTFLYSFCYKPFLADRVKAKGIFWDMPSVETLKLARDKPSFYMTKHKLLYHNRIAKLFEQMKTNNDINSRLEKYFDNLFIDEIQDFGGHDFNFLKEITKANLNIMFVGDFFQHTFDTSTDGRTNQSLHKNYITYKKEFQKMGLTIDTESLNKSYRCSQTVCEFVNNNLKINIKSQRSDITNIINIENEEEVKMIFRNNSIIKLFFQKANTYDCYCINWGKSKGQDHYQDVCIVLNSTTLKHFKSSTLHELAPSTKNKLYVACTRCRGDLIFIDEKKIKSII